MTPREQAIRQIARDIAVKLQPFNCCDRKLACEDCRNVVDALERAQFALLDQPRAEGQPPHPATELEAEYQASREAQLEADVATLRQQLAQAKADYRAEVKEHSETIKEFAAKDIALKAAEAQLAQAQQERDTWIKMAGVEADATVKAQSRAEAAEATVASLRQLSEKWRGPLRSIPVKRCADELDAALAALPTPSREEPREAERADSQR